jgi:hypothetical protein
VTTLTASLISPTFLIFKTLPRITSRRLQAFRGSGRCHCHILSFLNQVKNQLEFRFDEQASLSSVQIEEETKKPNQLPTEAEKLSLVVGKMKSKEKVCRFVSALIELHEIQDLKRFFIYDACLDLDGVHLTDFLKSCFLKCKVHGYSINSRSFYIESDGLLSEVEFFGQISKCLEEAKLNVKLLGVLSYKQSEQEIGELVED